ncbi:MAG: 30S ribosomal protein S27ae [Candidatus Diapherotrites archaeon CG11_big_fil_rev_8_21_14_0_20_37_9]|nr:MAG: 30S ribosomal protein S27ae [Candidatus Diapherotrites archaeon CG11_big_fil_rev_8_21_14_0_20_37_9]
MAEKKEPKGKKPPKKHPAMKKGSYYKVEGDKAIKERKVCPKCGPGVFMAQHEKRMHCGNCGYTEFKK